MSITPGSRAWSPTIGISRWIKHLRPSPTAASSAVGLLTAEDAAVGDGRKCLIHREMPIVGDHALEPGVILIHKALHDFLLFWGRLAEGGTDVFMGGTLERTGLNAQFH